MLDPEEIFAVWGGLRDRGVGGLVFVWVYRVSITVWYCTYRRMTHSALAKSSAYSYPQSASSC